MTAPVKPLPSLPSRSPDGLADDPSPVAPTTQASLLEPNPDDKADPEPSGQLPSLLPADQDFDDVVGAPTPVIPQITLDLTYVVKPHFLHDTKGEPITFRLSPRVSEMIDRIIHSKATPYQTKSEFFRDAAYYLAKGLVTLYQIQDLRLKALLDMAVATAEADFDARHRERLLKWEHDLTDGLLYQIERGDVSEALKLIDRRESEARRIGLVVWQRDFLRVLATNPIVQIVRQHASQHPSKTA